MKASYVCRPVCYLPVICNPYILFYVYFITRIRHHMCSNNGVFSSFIVFIICFFFFTTDNFLSLNFYNKKTQQGIEFDFYV